MFGLRSIILYKLLLFFLAQTSGNNDENTQKIETVEREIAKVQGEIELTQKEINQLADRIIVVEMQLEGAPLGSPPWKFLVDQKKQLRDEEKQLHDKENKLHDKEKQLHDKEKQLRDKEADMRKLLHIDDGKDS